MTKTGLLRSVILVLLLAALGGAIWYFSTGRVDRKVAFWGHHCIMAGIWLTLTLSLNLINGCCGLFSLGHQGFWAAGAYAAGATVVYLPHGTGTNWLGFVLSFAVGTLVAALFGLLVGLPCLRLKGDYLAIATLGFSEILRNVIQNSEPLGLSLGLSVPHVVRDSTSAFANYGIYLALAWGLAGATALLLRNLMRSTHGRAIQAIRDDERAAELLGVNLTSYKVFVFVTGAAIAGLAGALYANYNGFVTLEDFNFNAGVLMVVMVVLGGMGDLLGTALATVALYFFPVLLALWLPATRVPVFYDPTQGGVVYSEIKNLWQVFFSLLLIVVVLVRPEGVLKGVNLRALWGKKRSRMEPDAAAHSAPILAAERIEKRFGGLSAVADFSVSIGPGERVGLIGPNGAGKTTVFNLLTGVYKPDAGRIRVGGIDTRRLKPHRVTALGVARTFQNIRLFRDMTVLENVMTGFQTQCKTGILPAVLKTRRSCEEEERIHHDARELLNVMGLADKSELLSRNLPYGAQRKLEIARALAAAPRLLLLDEPAAGMNDTESAALQNLLLEIRAKFSLSLLVIEHDMHFVMGLVQRLLVLDHGVTIAQGTPAEVRAHPAVIEAYLGKECS